MVSFQCHACGDVVKKPKLDQHRGRCQAGFDCIDCHTTFNGPTEYKNHTKCISEAEKYQKGLYKGPKPSTTGTPAEINNTVQSHSSNTRNYESGRRGIGYTNGNTIHSYWMRGGPSGANDVPLGIPVRMSPVTAPSPTAVPESPHDSKPNTVAKLSGTAPVQGSRKDDRAEKKIKKQKVREELNAENDTVVNNTEAIVAELPAVLETAAGKKHKKKRETAVAEEAVINGNPTSVPASESMDKKHKKKKKDPAFVSTEEAIVSVPEAPVVKLEKSKKKKKRDSITTPPDVVAAPPETPILTGKDVSEPAGERRNKKKHESVTASMIDVNVSLVETTIVQSKVGTPGTLKKKKKGDSNSVPPETSVVQVEKAAPEPGVKKQKKKKGESIPAPMEDVDLSSPQTTVIQTEEKGLEKHKKKKKGESISTPTENVAAVVDKTNKDMAPAQSKDGPAFAPIETAEKKRKKRKLESAIPEDVAPDVAIDTSVAQDSAPSNEPPEKNGKRKKQKRKSTARDESTGRVVASFEEAPTIQSVEMKQEKRKKVTVDDETPVTYTDEPKKKKVKKSEDVDKEVETGKKKGDGEIKGKKRKAPEEDGADDSRERERRKKGKVGDDGNVDAPKASKKEKKRKSTTVS